MIDISVICVDNVKQGAFRIAFYFSLSRSDVDTIADQGDDYSFELILIGNNCGGRRRSFNVIALKVKSSPATEWVSTTPCYVVYTNLFLSDCF